MINDRHNSPLVFAKDQVSAVAQMLKDKLYVSRIMTFTGPLGAGKTTLIKALLKQCGISETITSPTFNYVNSYKNQRGETFYHFDLYRIKDKNEFLAMGFDEYLQVPDSRVLIEWPEVIESLLTDEVCHISLDYALEDAARVIRCIQK